VDEFIYDSASLDLYPNNKLVHYYDISSWEINQSYLNAYISDLNKMFKDLQLQVFKHFIKI